jgi:hypothetical protein
LVSVYFTRPISHFAFAIPVASQALAHMGSQFTVAARPASCALTSYSRPPLT